MSQCKITLLDPVNCVISGLSPHHIDYMYALYGQFAVGYRFSPKFKLGSWDGKIRFFSKTGKTYVNLLSDIIPHIIGLKYKISVVDKRPPVLSVDIPLVDKDFFHHIIDPDTDEPWEMRDYQVNMVNTLITNNGGIGVAGTGSGKALSLKAKVLTPEGWKLNGNLQPGDIVVTPSNQLSTITDVFPQAEKELFKITFHDGSSVDCCGEHLWQTYFPHPLHKASTNIKIVTTNDIIQFLDRKKTGIATPGNVSIPLVEPIQLPYITHDIEPYALGLLIGDGCLQKHSTSFSSADSYLIETLNSMVVDFNVHLVHQENYDYRITKNEKQNSFPPTKNLLTEHLKKLGLTGKRSFEKFIPDSYKQGTIEQRFELLRGLMDTDGTAGKSGSMSYSTTSKKLALDLQMLVWSLGGTCTITSRFPKYTYKGEQKTGREAYTCFIAHPTPKKLFNLKRKQNRVLECHAKGRITLTRRIINIESIGWHKSQCITIDDPSSLYITDDYIVTHNTSMTAAVALSYELSNNLRSLIIVPDKNLTSQTYADYEFFGLDVGEYSGTRKDTKHMHVVSTWQALQHNPTIVSEFDVVIVDECHGAKGKVISKLLNVDGINVPFRFGVTGTFPKEPIDQMTINIALGEVLIEIPAHELIAQGFLAKINIDICQLKSDFLVQYDEYLTEYMKNPIAMGGAKKTYIQFKNDYFPDWPAEKSYFQSDKERLGWIKDYIELASENGNVFCLVTGIAFGKRLTKMIPNAVFIYGKDPMEDREKIYKMFATHDNLIIIANAKVASTGLNIKRIFELMLIDIGKSFVGTIQGIGRGLRKAKDKDSVHVTDICCDLLHSKRHLRTRINYYIEAKYPYKKTTVDYR